MALEHRMAASGFVITYALRVLETVDRYGQGVSAAQLAGELRVGPERLAPVLATLEQEGYLLPVADGVFVLGDSAVLLGGTGRTRAEAEADRVHGALARLRDEVDAAVYFGRYEDGEVRVVDCADSAATPRANEWVDIRSAAHATAFGKCLLGQLDPDARRDHLDRHRPIRLTSRTITGERSLLALLDAQPPGGPVLDLQEYALGTVCAAVPVTVGGIRGALAVSLPLERMHRLRCVADTLSRRSAPVLLSQAL